MSNLGNRIWAELSESLYYNYYLSMYIDRDRKIKRNLELASFIITFCGLIGVYRDLLPKWVLIIVLFLQVGMFLRKFYLRNDIEILRLERLNIFYAAHRLDLEHLWSDYYSDLIDENKADKKFKTLQRKEAQNSKDIGHGLVPNVKKINILASERRNKYLEKFQ